MGSKIEVSRCNLHVGSMQIGILLVSVNDVIIRDNYLNPVTNPDNRVFYVQKSLLLKTNSAYRDLVFALGKISSSIPLSQKAQNAGKNIKDLMNNGVALLKSRRIAEAVELFKETITTNDRMGDLLRQVLLRGIPETSLSKFNDAVSSYGKISTTLKQAISLGFSPDAISKANEALEICSLVTNLIREGISLIGDEAKTHAEEELSLHRDMVYAAVTGNLDNPKFNAEILKIIKSINGDLVVGYQGITCAGRYW